MSAELKDVAEPGASVFRADWEAWHRAVDDRRRDPRGPLGFTGLHWLGETPTTIPNVPGAYRVEGAVAIVDLDPGELLEYGGAKISGSRELDPASGDRLVFADGEAELARRGEHVVLRTRLRDNPFAAAFGGTPAFAPEKSWVVSAQFIAAPAQTQVGAAVGDFTHELSSPGSVHFALDGVDYEFTVFDGHEPGTWRLPFTDATSGVETYPAGRNVVVRAVADGERTVIDFTRAANMPCAYSDMTTCPLPPRANRIASRVAAGERSPGIRLVSAADGTASVAEIAPPGL